MTENIKSTLKTGMIVFKRNGDVRRVFLNTRHAYPDVIVDEDGFWDTLDNYNDDLTHKTVKELDIMQIAYNDSISDLCYAIDKVDIKYVWRRLEPKEMTIAEIEEILGYPIKVVKE